MTMIKQLIKLSSFNIKIKYEVKHNQRTAS